MVFIQGTRFTRGSGTNRKGAAGPCINTTSRSSTTILHTSHPAFEDGTDTVFRNVGILQFKSDAGEIPKRIHTFTIYCSLPCILRRGLRPLACWLGLWVSFPPTAWMPSLRRTDLLSRGVLPSMVCLCVTVNPR